MEEALDRLARHPSTARHISRTLVQYWLSDPPPPALVERVAQAFTASDGDIAFTLRTLLGSPEFAQGAGRQCNDPMRFVVSALRMTHDDRVILNTGPVLFWLSRLGQPLCGCQTPDGWPLNEAAWSSPGQMTARFEVARAIGSGSGGLFSSSGTPNGTLPGPHRRSQRRALYVFGGWYLAAASAAMSIAVCILSVVTSSSELTAEKAPLLMMTISTMAI